MTMKLVVTGTSGVWRRSTSTSARSWSRNASEENLAKSSCCVGFENDGAIRGGSISSQVL